MRPEHVIWIDQNENTLLQVDEMISWCQTKVGVPYPIIDNPSDGVPRGFDYNDEEGKWCCYSGNHVGNGRIVSTWCFRNEKDASFFALRWA